jgi:hypothetical protein
LTATDSDGALVSDTFDIVVSNVNDATTVANAITEQTISNGSAMYFRFDATTFVDVDVSDTLSYVASLSDGTALPSWLTFDATARTFTGTPTESDIGSLAIKVTATDTGSVTVFDTFNITVTITNAAPTLLRQLLPHRYKTQRIPTLLQRPTQMLAIH